MVTDFQSVHDLFRPQVLRHLRRLVGEADAEDLAQSVMLKISAALPGFRGDSSLATWVYRVTTNVALDHLRGRRASSLAGEKVQLESEEDLPLSAQSPSVETAAIRQEMSECIREFIERLPASYRAVMVLSELEGFTNDEIASILGISLATAKIRLHRGREKLREELKQGCSFHRSDDDELACDRSPTAPITLHRRR